MMSGANAPLFDSSTLTAPLTVYVQLNVYVQQTLDDLEHGQLDLDTALRTLARIAFDTGSRWPTNPDGHPCSAEV